MSTGFGTLVTKSVWAEDYTSVALTLEFDKDLAGKEVAVLARLADGTREIKVKAGRKPLNIKID